MASSDSTGLERPRSPTIGRPDAALGAVQDIQASALGDYRVLTPERVSLELATAGIGSRGAAALIDSLIQWVITMLLFIPAALIFFMLFRPPGRAPASSPGASGGAVFQDVPVWVWLFFAFILILVFAIQLGYFVLFEIVWNGQTPGKRAMGLRVVRENGYPLRAVDAVVRNLVRIVDALPSGYAIGLLAMLLNSRSKRLGDFAAGTIVVRETKATLGALTLGGGTVHSGTVDPVGAKHSPADLPSASAGNANASPWGGAADESSFHLPTLDAAHATLVRDFLFRRHSLEPKARMQLAARLADTIAARYTLQSLRASQDAEPFLEHFG